MSRNIDVKELLKDQIGDRGTDSSYRIYNNNGSNANITTSQASIPRPLTSHVPRPTDPAFMANFPGGIPYAEAVAIYEQAQRDAQHNVRRDSQHNATHAQTQSERSQHGIRKNEIGVEDNYFLLDSYFKSTNSVPSSGLYIFDLARINDVTPIANVIEMQITNFTIPTLAYETYQVDPFICRVLYIDFENIRAQQFVHGDYESALRNTHFSLALSTSTDTPGRLVCSGSDPDKYIFTIPVQSIQKLCIRFKVSDRWVPFLNDTFNATPVPSGGPSPLNRRIVTDTAHGLTGVANIYVVGFASTNDNLNNFMNSTAGHVVAVIDAVTLQFTLAPTVAEGLGTALTATGGTVRFTIRIPERRIAFSVRFRSIIPRTTNFISP